MPRTISGHTEEDRQPVSFRMRRPLYERVRGLAMAEKRSLSEVFAVLIERGMDNPSTAFGSYNGHTFARALLAAAEAAVARYGAHQGLWLYDNENYDRAAAAMHQMIESLRPVPEAQETQEALAKIEEARKQYLRLVKGKQAQAS